LRIVFFGTPEMAVPSLNQLMGKHHIVAVVCQPDKPVGRKKKLQPPPTKVWAEERGITAHQPKKLNDGEFEEWLKRRQPDVCALVAYGRILKQPILDVPTHGFLNMHPSLLPKYRGPSPIQSAVLAGDEKTGVTIMRLDAGTDTGDMILQKTVPIEPSDTGGTMTDKLAEIGAHLLEKALILVETGEAQFAPQDSDAATHTNMFSKKDGAIDWSRSATEIHHQIRACNPWPMAYTQWNEQPLRFHKSFLSNEDSTKAPGTVIFINQHAIHIATGFGVIAIETLQMPGKKALKADDFLRGRELPVGTQFGEPNDAG
jgi:methionyl-tRNA formyltransferase